MFDKIFNIETEFFPPSSLPLGFDEITDMRPSQIVNNVLIRPEGLRNVHISWTSDDEKAISWVFINGRLVFGPLMTETKERSIVLSIPHEGTFKIEVHDSFDHNVVPASFEEPPLVAPTIAWSKVEAATFYRIYHTIYNTGTSATGTIEYKLIDIPAMPMDRIEIDCPVKLEGRSWHLFRIEAVDQFGNESESHRLAFFAADFPMPPQLSISRNTETGLLNFRIES